MFKYIPSIWADGFQKSDRHVTANAQQRSGPRAKRRLDTESIQYSYLQRYASSWIIICQQFYWNFCPAEKRRHTHIHNGFSCWDVATLLKQFWTKKPAKQLSSCVVDEYPGENTSAELLNRLYLRSLISNAATDQLRQTLISCCRCCCVSSKKTREIKEEQASLRHTRSTISFTLYPPTTIADNSNPVTLTQSQQNVVNLQRTELATIVNARVQYIWYSTSEVAKLAAV